MSRTPLRYAFIALVLYGCAGGAGACGGCAAIDPIPDGGRTTFAKVDNAVSVRVGDGGFAALNSDWQQILATFAPGNRLDVPLSCSIQSVTLVGNVAISDMGSAGCTSEACGRMDGICDARDVPHNIGVTFTSLSFAPRAPDQIEASVDLQLATNKFYVDSVSRNSGLCLFSGGGPFKCGVDFDTARAAPSDNVIKAQIQFVIDTRWDKLLRFDIANIGGSSVCSGSATAPNCLDPADLLITNECPADGCSCNACSLASWEPIKAIILAQVVGQLKSTLQDQLDKLQCQPCSLTEPACPFWGSSTSTCNAKADAGEDGGLCIDNVTGRCVPSVFGIEGRVDVAKSAPTLSPPADAKLDISIALGGNASADTGLNLGLRGNAHEVSPSACVKSLPALPITAQQAPNFDAEATRPYDIAFSVSRQFLNQVAFHTEQSGAMCVALGTASFPQLDSSLFRPLLPSLGKILGPNDVPMQIALRPTQAPQFSVGKGEVDSTGKLVTPLVSVDIKDLGLDFYALVEERYARLFTLTVDVHLDFAVQAEGCIKLTPVIGSLQNAVTNVRPSNDEMLADDISQFAKLVPAFIALAEPALANGLPSTTISPPLGPFQLKVSEVHGVAQVPGTQSYDGVGVFTQLIPAGAACEVLVPRTTATLARADIPDGYDTWPTAVLDVQSTATDARYQFRVDSGLWSTLRAAPSGTLEVQSPIFLLEGHHVIEVRSREAMGTGSSAPVRVGLVVDRLAPEVRLTPDRANDRLSVSARDTVTPADALLYAYSVGGGAFSEFGSPRPIVLSAVEAEGGVTVRVRDESGRVGEAAYRVATTATHAGATSTPSSQSTGCAAAPGLFAALGLLALLRRRR